MNIVLNKLCLILWYSQISYTLPFWFIDKLPHTLLIYYPPGQKIDILSSLLILTLFLGVQDLADSGLTRLPSTWAWFHQRYTQDCASSCIGAGVCHYISNKWDNLQERYSLINQEVARHFVHYRAFSIIFRYKRSTNIAAFCAQHQMSLPPPFCSMELK